MSAYCTVVYQGGSAPDHLRAGMTLKGVEFASGKEVEVPAALAGLLKRSLPIGATVKVVSGTPTDSPAKVPDLKALAHATFGNGADPAKIVGVVPALTAKSATSVLGADEAGAAYVDAGSADAELGTFALVAQALGKSKAAAAAARRFLTIRGN